MRSSVERQCKQNETVPADILKLLKPEKKVSECPPEQAKYLVEGKSPATIAKQWANEESRLEPYDLPLLIP